MPTATPTTSARDEQQRENERGYWIHVQYCARAALGSVKHRDA